MRKNWIWENMKENWDWSLFILFVVAVSCAMISCGRNKTNEFTFEATEDDLILVFSRRCGWQTMLLVMALLQPAQALWGPSETPGTH